MMIQYGELDCRERDESPPSPSAITARSDELSRPQVSARAFSSEISAISAASGGTNVHRALLHLHAFVRLQRAAKRRRRVEVIGWGNLLYEAGVRPPWPAAVAFLAERHGHPDKVLRLLRRLLRSPREQLGLHELLVVERGRKTDAELIELHVKQLLQEGDPRRQLLDGIAFFMPLGRQVKESIM